MCNSLPIPAGHGSIKFFNGTCGATPLRVAGKNDGHPGGGFVSFFLTQIKEEVEEPTQAQAVLSSGFSAGSLRRFVIRRSKKSFSGYVAVCISADFRRAAAFAVRWAGRCGVPCRLRPFDLNGEQCHAVSVPCLPPAWRVNPDTEIYFSSWSIRGLQTVTQIRNKIT